MVAQATLGVHKALARAVRLDNPKATANLATLSGGIPCEQLAQLSARHQGICVNESRAEDIRDLSLRRELS